MRAMENGADDAFGEMNLANGAKAYLRPIEAAEYCGLSQSTLAKMRMRHSRANGPKFGRLGGCVIYRRSDLDDWISSQISARFPE
jgi:predicted DNA-binding transcriptional regulator AlpA